MAMAGIGAALVIGATASFASAQTVETIKSAGTVKIGMMVDFPPFGIMNTSNEPDGYDADVAKLLGKEWGVKVQIVPVTGPNRIPYLQSNQVDLLVASLGITEERAKNVDFSQPYAGTCRARRSASPVHPRRIRPSPRSLRRTPRSSVSMTMPAPFRHCCPVRSS